MKNHNQKGRSMVEMLGVLAIIGVLSVGGIAGYNMAMTKHRINQTIEQIQLINTVIQGLYGKEEDYTELTTAIVANNSSFTCINNNCDEGINAPLGPITVKGFHDGSYIISANIPRGSCARIATQNWKGFAYGISINSNIHLNLPISVEDAINECLHDTSTTINWGFGQNAFDAR